jgi:C4-dicarboxylate-specific signal transduction histidine kinase
MESPPPARLIVVDDEPVVLNLVAGLFQGESGVETIRCRDGAEALAAMERGVDVLLTDKNLPDLGGLELARAARARFPDVEIIIITGYASLETAIAALELDVFDYIVKPAKDIHEIRRKVRQALQKQRMGRENKRLLADLRDRNVALEQALGELREVQAELIQSEKLAGIGTLASGIAHEISSPLFGVMGLAEAILEEEDPDLVRGYAREIVDYAGTIKDIVVQLSGYSRTASSEYHTTVDLPRALDDAVRLVVRSVSFDPSCVVVEAEPELYVNARTSEVQQVFVNLVKNAVEALIERYGHHTPGSAFPGRVHVRAGRTDKVVWATVADNGPGIPTDRVNAIFDPFYTTKPPGRGTGLGLNIVWRILTKYRGQVLVESAEGKGATFTVRFPLEDSAAIQG